MAHRRIHRIPRLHCHYNNDVQSTIRRIVHHCIVNTPEVTSGKHQKTNFQMDGISQVLDASKPVWARVIWGIAFLSCLTTCTFLVLIRVNYFLSEPIAVDVKIIALEEVQFPAFTLFPQNSKAIHELIQNSSINGLDAIQCISPMLALLTIVKGMTVAKLWKLLRSIDVMEDIQVVARKTSYDVKWSKGNGTGGTETTVELDRHVPDEGIGTMFVVKINSTPIDCIGSPIIGTIQPVGTPSDLRLSWLYNSQTTLEFSLTILKYEFVNRRTSPCTEDQDFYRCKDRCLVQHFRNIPCRFPFMPKELVLRPCYLRGDESVKQLYIESIADVMKLRCKCPRRCHELTFNVGMNFLHKNKKPISILSWYFDHNRMVVIKERIAYDVVNLMSDTGGNLGLCLGLSILSIFQILHEFLTIFISKLKRKKCRLRTKHFLAGAPFIRYIFRTLGEEQYRLQVLQTISNKKHVSSFRKLAWYSIIATCAISSFFFIYVRLSRYWSLPTNTIVEILDHPTVHFPTVTICGLSVKFIKKLQKLARKQKNYIVSKSLNKEMPNWCSMEIVDLLETHANDIDRLWTMTSVYEEFALGFDILELFLGFSFIRNVTSKELFLPDGYCIEYNIGEQIHVGSNTIFSKITSSRAFKVFKDEMAQCERHYHSVYLTPPHGLFHLNTRLLYPYSRRSQMMLEYQKVTRLNLPKKPCTTTENYNQCYARCFHTILLRQSIPCRLPYMPTSLNVTTCKKRAESHVAQKSYLHVALTFDPLKYKECGCVQRCQEVILKCVEYTEPH